MRAEEQLINEKKNKFLIEKQAVKIKKDMDVSELCNDLPIHFFIYMKYLKSL